MKLCGCRNCGIPCITADLSNDATGGGRTAPSAFFFSPEGSSATKLHLPSAGDVQYEPLVAGPGGPEPLARGVKKEFEKKTSQAIDTHRGGVVLCMSAPPPLAAPKPETHHFGE